MPGGRKGKYEYWLTEDGLLLIQGWARNGLTDEQIAHNIGVSRKTLSEWKFRFSDIGNALKKTKEIVDLEVENALLKRAKGYRYKEITKETRYDLNGNQYEYVKEVEKEMPPDTGAIVFWLKNRRPERWRDKPPDAEADRLVTVKVEMGDYGD